MRIIPGFQSSSLAGLPSSIEFIVTYCGKQHYREAGASGIW